MKSPALQIVYKSVKFSLLILSITSFLVFLAAPTVFGVALITPSLVAIAVGSAFLALLVGLLYNFLKALILNKRTANSDGEPLRTKQTKECL